METRLHLRLFFYDEIGRPLRIIGVWAPRCWTISQVVDEVLRRHPELSNFASVADQALN